MNGKAVVGQGVVQAAGAEQREDRLDDREDRQDVAQHPSPRAAGATLPGRRPRTSSRAPAVYRQIRRWAERQLGLRFGKDGSAAPLPAPERAAAAEEITAA